MHAVIFGGTGRSGSAVAEALLERDAVVTLFLRESSKVAANLSGKVQEFRGSITDDDAVRAALVDADAAVICVGNSSLIKRETLRADVTRAVCKAVKETSVLVVVVSVLGARGSATQLQWWIRPVASFGLQQPIKDHNDQEDVLEAEIPLERRLVVRPVALTDGPLTADYFVSATDVCPAVSISRKDLAHFIAAQLCPPTDNEQHVSYFGQFVGISLQ